MKYENGDSTRGGTPLVGAWGCPPTPSNIPKGRVPRAVPVGECVSAQRAASEARTSPSATGFARGYLLSPKNGGQGVERTILGLRLSYSRRAIRPKGIQNDIFKRIPHKSVDVIGNGLAEA